MCDLICVHRVGVMSCYGCLHCLCLNVCACIVHIKVEPCNLYIPSLINNHFTLPLFSSEHHKVICLALYRKLRFMFSCEWIAHRYCECLDGLTGWAGLALVLESFISCDLFARNLRK